MFVDRIKIHAKAGDGGCGCVSFRREKFVPRGGPDGGDGGKGGDIILRADVHTDNLTALFYEPLMRSKTGAHGKGKQMHGRGAAVKIVKVPIGTVVYRLPENVEMRNAECGMRNEEAAGNAEMRNAECGIRKEEAAVETQSDAEQGAEHSAIDIPHSAFLREVPDDAPVSMQPGLEQVADLTHEGQEYILCHGGAGGRGNVHFKSGRNRAPRQYTEGNPGGEGHFLFELRTIADAGLVGYPNAGKSTLLGKISAAHPKVAAYPFTTLHPMIGVVEFSPGYRRVTVADIPGLIEGAHRNVGLGHDFLRHITRCRLLLFVLDMAGSEGRNPTEDLQHLRREIDLYDTRLSQRPWKVVANKMDLPEAEENLAAFRVRFPQVEVAAISAEAGTGFAELKARLADWL